MKIGKIRAGPDGAGRWEPRGPSEGRPRQLVVQRTDLRGERGRRSRGRGETGLEEDAVAALLTAYAVGMGLPVEGPADGPATQGGAEETRRWS